MTLQIIEIISTLVLLSVCFFIAFLIKRYEMYQLEEASKRQIENQMLEKQYHLYLLKKQQA